MLVGLERSGETLAAETVGRNEMPFSRNTCAVRLRNGLTDFNQMLHKYSIPRQYELITFWKSMNWNQGQGCYKGEAALRTPMTIKPFLFFIELLVFQKPDLLLSSVNTFCIVSSSPAKVIYGSYSPAMNIVIRRSLQIIISCDMLLSHFGIVVVMLFVFACKGNATEDTNKRTYRSWFTSEFVNIAVWHVTVVNLK